jgi:hypothetical protein
MVEKGLISQAEAALLSADHMDEAISSSEKQIEALREYAEVGGTEMTRKLDALKGITGQTDQELRDLAKTMGVNLKDGTMSVADAMTKLGISAKRTEEELRAVGRQIYASLVEDLITKPKEIEDATYAVDQAGEALRQFGTSASESQVRDFLGTMFNNALTMNNGDPVAAMNFVRGSVGSIYGSAFTADERGRGPLSDPGMAQMFADRGGFATVGEFTNRFSTDYAKERATNFSAALQQDFGVGMSGGNLQAIMAKIETGLRTPGQEEQTRRVLDRLTQITENGATDQFGNRMSLSGEDMATYVENELRNVGLDVDLQSMADANASAMEATQNMSTAAKEMATAVSSAFERPDWFNNKPVWWDTPPAAVSGGGGGVRKNFASAGGGPDNDDNRSTPEDTRTPRAFGDAVTSRLGRTMSRHGFFDSQLAGKRSVTSSWRNWGLGSINSDHVTGNAYDLSGQNLGAYATMVNKMGGFAEFHGAAGGRHLHVVPGQTPVGDSTSPVGMGPTAVMAGGPTTYNVTVNAMPGQDVNAIAAAVMAQIESKERSNRERA